MRYKIPSKALSITLNALGDPNRILASVVSRAVVMAFDGDNIGYGPDLNYQHWPLTAYPTQFADDKDKYVHIAIPRSSSVGREAIVVFPSYILDATGYADIPTGNQDEDGNDITEHRLVGNTDYWYIYLQGVILAPVNGMRQWKNPLVPFDVGDLDSNAAYDAGPLETDWYRYDAHADVDGRMGLVTFKRDLDLLRNDKGAPSVGFRTMRIGDAVMRWDKEKSAIILEHISGNDTMVHLAATGDLCAFGFGTSGGGGGTGGGTGGSTVAWQQLYNDTTNGTKIAIVTIDGTTHDVYAPKGGGTGGGSTPVSWADIAPAWLAGYTTAAPPVSTFSNDKGYITKGELDGYGFVTQKWVIEKFALKATTLSGYGITDALAFADSAESAGNHYVGVRFLDDTLKGLATTQCIQWYSGGWFNMSMGKLGVGGADPCKAPFNGYDFSVNGNSYLNGTLRIGDALLKWDNTNKALMLSHATSSGTMVHLAATGDLCAFGFSTSGGGSGTGGGGGTLSSVGLVMPSMFTVANSPLTADGNITVSLKDAYTIPTTATLNAIAANAEKGAVAYGWGDHKEMKYLVSSQSSGMETGHKHSELYITGTSTAYMVVDTGNKTIDFMYRVRQEYGLTFSSYKSAVWNITYDGEKTGEKKDCQALRLTNEGVYARYGSNNPELIRALAFKDSIGFADLSSHPTTVSGYGITDALYFQARTDTPERPDDLTKRYVGVVWNDSAMREIARSQCIQWYNGGWINMTMGKLGAGGADVRTDAYKNYALGVNGDTRLTGKLRVGDAYLSYDSTNKALRLYRLDDKGVQQECHFIAAGDVAAFNALGAFNALDSLTLANALSVGKTMYLGQSVMQSVLNDAGDVALSFNPSGNVTVGNTTRPRTLNVEVNGSLKLKSANITTAAITTLSVGSDPVAITRLSLNGLSGSNPTSTSNYLYITIGSKRYRITMQEMS